MQTLSFFCVFICFGAVLAWYALNEEQGADGSAGYFSVRKTGDPRAVAVSAEASGPPVHDLRFRMQEARGSLRGVSARDAAAQSRVSWLEDAKEKASGDAASTTRRYRSIGEAGARPSRAAAKSPSRSSAKDRLDAGPRYRARTRRTPSPLDVVEPA